MNTFLMWLGGLLIAVFALLFAGPHFVDWNSYRGVFEEEATRALGRRVRVGGNVNVRLLPAPYVLFEDLRISDTTGIAGAPLFKTKSFKMWLSVPPLLKGVMEANKVELEKPVISLAADQEGRGNWRTLLDVHELPFVPAGVKFDSVAIEDGVLSYSIEGSGELTRIEKISGELSAQALAGPYAYRGTASFDGSETGLRVATTEADRNGNFRLTALLNEGRGGNSHKFDGQVVGLWDKPRIEGDLTSKLNVVGEGEGGKLIADVRGKALADGQSLKVEDLTISFDEFAQPQVVSGAMEAQWTGRQDVSLVLNSRWLDIDILTAGARGDAGGSAGSETSSEKVPAAVPLTTARKLIAALLNVFPGKTDVKARLDVDQIKLGNETVAGLIVSMERTAGTLNLRTLRAVLPGAARLDFSGTVDVVAGQPVFDGDLFLGGVSAAKVIRWAMGPSVADAKFSDGPFTVSGRMQLGSDKVLLDSASAEFSGVPISGRLDWSDGDKPYVDLDLEGYEVDTRWFGLGSLPQPSLTEIFSGHEAAKSGKSEASAAEPAEEGAGDTADDSVSLADLFGRPELDGREIKLVLKAGRLTDGINTLHDVDAKALVKGRKIDIDRMKLTTTEGLQFETSGTIDGLGSAPVGQLSYLVSANDKSAAGKLADLWSGDEPDVLLRDRFGAVAPVRLAGDIKLGKRLGGASDFTFDGTAAGGHIAGHLRLDGGVGNWSGAPVDLVVRSNVADMAGVIASVVAGQAVPDAGAGSIGRNEGQLLIKSVGVPSSQSGLLTFVSVDDGNLSIVFDGSAGLSDDEFTSLNGELALRTGDVRSLLTSVGLALPQGAGDLSYDGQADIAWSGSKLVFVPRDVAFAGAKVGGRLIVKTDEDGAKSVDGKLVTDVASLPRILGLATPGSQGRIEERQVARAEGLADQARAIVDGGEGAAPGPLFSNAPFDFNVIEGLSGAIELRSARLVLADGLAVSNARSHVKLGPQQISFELDEADALGGKLSGNLNVAKAAAGANSKGQLALRGANLKDIALATKGPDGEARLGRGQVDITLNFQGRALTPSGAVSVANGEGAIELDGVTLVGLIPTGVRETAEAALTGSGLPSEEIQGLLSDAWRTGSMQLSNQTVGLSLVDGVIHVAAIDAGSENNRIVVTSSLNAKTLSVDSEWRVVADDPNAGRPWPSVVVSRRGPLTQLAGLPPQFVADALQRELSVRKMERNVDELERLRRLDEEAAARQRERERQLELESQRLEAQRAAAAAAAAARAAGDDITAPAPVPANPGLGSDGAFPPQVPVGDPGAQGQFPPGPQGANSAPPGNTDGTAAGLNTPPETKKRRYRPRPKPKPKSLTNQIFGIE